MLKHYFLVSIIALFLFSCTSPYGSGGIKFSNRAGIYQNNDKTITVTITDKDKNNLTINVTSPESIRDTINVSSSSTSTYMRIDSENFNYIYLMNFGNNVKNIFITIKNDKDKNIIFNEKLTIVK